ncbi:MAG: glycine cleavage system protein T [Pseudomonadota bacterium]
MTRYRLHIGPNIRKSPFFDATVADGVRSFSVYNHMYIPGHFGDPGAEYDRLIHGVAMWDVAAQRQVALEGSDAGRLAQVLTPRDLDDTPVGQGRYVPICDHDGWLINDPVLMPLRDDLVWLSAADSDLHLWAAAIARERGMDVRVHEPDVSPMAIQGPKAVEVAAALFGDEIRGMRPFAFQEASLDGIPLVLARSGWSKQGGFELYLMDATRGSDLWGLVKATGMSWDIGPGAPNDVERIESGLISYGADMRRQTHPADPFEMGLGKFVDLDGPHDFIGRGALAARHAAGPSRRRTGVVIAGSPVTANAHPLPLMRGDAQVGTVSEIARSRRLDRNIGVAMVLIGAEDDLWIDLSDGPRSVTLADLPFRR